MGPKIIDKIIPFWKLMLNTQYMTNSTLVCLVKMEYVTKNNDEKWSRKNYFEIPPYASHLKSEIMVPKM